MKAMSNRRDWILRIEFDNRRAENRLYKTETGARKAAQRMMTNFKNCKCRIFAEVGSVRQISIFDSEPEY